MQKWCVCVDLTKVCVQQFRKEVFFWKLEGQLFRRLVENLQVSTFPLRPDQKSFESHARRAYRVHIPVVSSTLRQAREVFTRRFGVPGMLVLELKCGLYERICAGFPEQARERCLDLYVSKPSSQKGWAAPRVVLPIAIATFLGGYINRFSLLRGCVDRAASGTKASGSSQRSLLRRYEGRFFRPRISPKARTKLAINVNVRAMLKHPLYLLRACGTVGIRGIHVISGSFLVAPGTADLSADSRTDSRWL